MSQIGLIVFGHGSSIESANQAVREVAAAMARSGGYTLVETAFLEGGRPDLGSAARTLVSRGAERLIVLPYFLTLGLHLQRDLPKLVNEVREMVGVPVEVTPPLDGHPALEQILLTRAREAVGAGS
ncbi:MAG TPA: CbiX/SirB N-terminal domain-containing protein [Bryobacteraceae bacterium]|jgi:sirohydrochlorin ferrochelatase